MTRRVLVVLVAAIALLAIAPAARAQTATSVSVDDPTVAETTGTNTTVTFKVTLNGPAPPSGVTVSYTTAPGTGANPAQSTSDFTGINGSLAFAEGQMSKDVVVPVIGDNNDEHNEVFRLVLSSVLPVSVSISKATGVATITDDDDPPAVNVSDAAVAQPVSDGVNKVVIFNVSLSRASGKVVTVDYATADGTGPNGGVACAGLQCNSPADGDYVPLKGVLTFNPGVTSLQVSVVAIGDSLDLIRTFSLTISNPSHLRSASVNFVPADEGKLITIAGSPRLIQKVNPNDAHDILLDQPLTNGVALPFTFSRTFTDGVVTGGSLQSNNADFVLGDVGKPIIVGGVPTTIATFVNAGQITLTDPVADGSPVTFTYSPNYADGQVTGGTNQTLGDATGTGTITSAGPGAKITGATVTEGAAGTTATASVEVTLTHPAPQELSLAIKTTDGTAKAPADYEPLPADQRVVFGVGETSRTIAIVVPGNDNHEGDKSFSVVLSDPINVSLVSANATAVVTIKNDDTIPGLVVSDLAVAEPKGVTGKVEIPVVLKATSTATLTAEWATADDTAISGVNYAESTGTLTFKPGETEHKITIPIAGDGTVTEDLSFTITIQDTTPDAPPVVVRVTLVDSDLTVDQMPVVSVNDASARRSVSGAAPVVFTVRLDRAPKRAVRVGYATGDGEAVAGRDYSPQSGTLRFPAGQTVATVTVPVLINQGNRSNASFSLALSNPVSGVIGRQRGVGIIINNDEIALPFRHTRVRASKILCRTTRRCTGVRASWTTPGPGTVRVAIVATLPRGKRTQSVVLASRTVKVKPGAGSMLVRRVSRRASPPLLRRVRAAKVKTVTLSLAYTTTLGEQYRATRTAPLGP